MFSPRDRTKCEELLDRYYTGRKFNDELYMDLIRQHLRKGQRVLDAGCGRYLRFCHQFAADAEMVGIDLDTTLETRNRNAPFGVRGDLSRLPFAAEQFDMVISRSVVEHLADPPQVFREFFRVLRPGGKVVVITPNKYDYVSLIAAVTPYRVHRALCSRIFNVPGDDVFPTLYRANSLRAIKRAFRSAGFSEIEVRAVNHYPAYLMFSPALFRLGVLYERFTSLRFGAWLRGSLLCAVEKPGPASRPLRMRNPGAIGRERIEAI